MRIHGLRRQSQDVLNRSTIGWPSGIGIALIFGPLLFAGCDNRQCTLIGCVNNISATFSEATVGGSQGLIEARFCMDGDCTELVGKVGHRLAASNDEGLEVMSTGQGIDVSLRLPEADYEGDLSHDVSIRLQLKGHDSVRLERTVELESSTPNGPKCGPVCWSGRIDGDP